MAQTTDRNSNSSTEVKKANRFVRSRTLKWTNSFDNFVLEHESNLKKMSNSCSNTKQIKERIGSDLSRNLAESYDTILRSSEETPETKTIKFVLEHDIFTVDREMAACSHSARTDRTKKSCWSTVKPSCSSAIRLPTSVICSPSSATNSMFVFVVWRWEHDCFHLF